MLKLSRQVDYALLLLHHLGRGLERNESACTARVLSERAHLPLPMTSKILKALAHGGVLTSKRGAHGGYALSRRPEQISLATIVEALEGPLALLACVGSEAHCALEDSCPNHAPMQMLQRRFLDFMRGLTLAELLQTHGDPQRETPRAADLVFPSLRNGGSPLKAAAKFPVYPGEPR